MSLPRMVMMLRSQDARTPNLQSRVFLVLQNNLCWNNCLLPRHGFHNATHLARHEGSRHMMMRTGIKQFIIKMENVVKNILLLCLPSHCPGERRHDEVAHHSLNGPNTKIQIQCPDISHWKKPGDGFANLVRGQRRLRRPVSIQPTGTTIATSFTTSLPSTTSSDSRLPSSSAQLLENGTRGGTRARTPRPGPEHCSVSKRLQSQMSGGMHTGPRTEIQSRRPLPTRIPSQSMKQHEMMSARATSEPPTFSAMLTSLSTIQHYKASKQSQA